MSTAGRGEPRSGAQRLGEPGSFDPALDHLITALTTSAHPHEVSGRDAALAAFRQASRRPDRAEGQARIRPSALSARLRRPAGPRRSARVLLPVRLAVAAASVVAVLGGLTAAAAAQALPAPVQQIAYHVLAPLGVPVSQPKPVHPHADSAPTRGGQASPSAAVTTAGSQSGAAAGPSASPTATATLKRKRKPKVKVPVTRPMLRLVSGKLNDRLIVAAPSDKAGDAANLTERVDGTWTTVASKSLGPKHRAFFVLPVTTAAGHLFKVEFPQATKKVTSASNLVWVPRRPGTGAKGIHPSPNPTTTAVTTPDASTSPVASATPSASSTALPPPPPPTGSPIPTATPTPTGSATPTPGGSPSPSSSPTSGASGWSQPPPPPI